MFTKFLEVAKGIYWIGSKGKNSGIFANPYLIIDEDEAIVIDAGSRPDFSDVMLKILQTGIKPQDISTLIYHHYDPDLCGSMQHFEEMISREDLKIISQKYNNSFILHYGARSTLLCIEDLNYEYVMKSGRKLVFHLTPYAHSPGSFITWDEKTRTLFTSDILGSYGVSDTLYLQVSPECERCTDINTCHLGKGCFMVGINHFQKLVMTSNKAFHHALDIIASYPAQRILPQHGNIIEGEKNVQIVVDKLRKLDGIGIDGPFGLR